MSEYSLNRGKNRNWGPRRLIEASSDSDSDSTRSAPADIANISSYESQNRSFTSSSFKYSAEEEVSEPTSSYSDSEDIPLPPRNQLTKQATFVNSPGSKINKSSSTTFDKNRSFSAQVFGSVVTPPVTMGEPLLMEGFENSGAVMRFEPEFVPGNSKIGTTIQGFPLEQQVDKLLRFIQNQNFAFTNDPRMQYQLNLPAPNHIGSPEVELSIAPFCALCKEPCKERCYFAHGNSYHPLCFKCSSCHRHLRPPNCVFMMDQPYCLYCSRKKQKVNRCPVCGLPIIDPRDEILPDCYNSPIHRTCLRCYVCSNGIGIDDYTLVSGKPVCKKCIEKLSDRICKKCGKVILERFIQFHGMCYHPEHFVCAQCNTVLKGDNFYFYRNKPYCPIHGEFYGTRKCWVCHGEFNDEDTIQWNGRKYHLDCFKCKKCGTKLNQDNWVRVHEYPYCEKCYKEYRDSKAAAAWKQANERKRTRRLKRTKKD